MRVALLLLPLLLVAATVSFYPDMNVTIDKQRFNTSVSGSSLIMKGDYYTVLLREGRCENKDIYVYCLDSVEYDRVRFYPHEHRVNLTWSRLCDDCYRFGQACEARVDCSGYCVHEVCRPSPVWCGDGFCDAGESCAIDCPINQSAENASLARNDTLGEDLSEAATPPAPDEQRPSTREESGAYASEMPAPPWKGIGIVVGGGALLILVIFGRKKREPEIL